MSGGHLALLVIQGADVGRQPAFVQGGPGAKGRGVFQPQALSGQN